MSRTEQRVAAAPLCGLQRLFAREVSQKVAAPRESRFPEASGGVVGTEAKKKATTRETNPKTTKRKAPRLPNGEAENVAGRSAKKRSEAGGAAQLCDVTNRQRHETARATARSWPDPVDPFSSSYRRRLLKEAGALVEMLTDESAFEAPFSLKAKKASNAFGGEGRKLVEKPTSAPTRLKNGPAVYLGHGNYGAVFRLRLDGHVAAVKVEKPLHALPWEAAALALFRRRERQAAAAKRTPTRRRRPPPLGEVVSPTGLWLWRDGAALAMPCYDCTLADALRAGPRLPESAAVFLAAALLQPLARLHAASLIHCDIKPDNFLLRFKKRPSSSSTTSIGNFDGIDDGLDDALSSRASGVSDSESSTEICWPEVVLADLGRCVDLERHCGDGGTDGALFASSRAHIDDYVWPPAKRGVPWTYEVDRYALGVVLHLVALGRLPARARDIDPKTTPRLPRGWDKAFWDAAFSTLLSTQPPKPDAYDASVLPPASELQFLADDAHAAFSRLIASDPRAAALGLDHFARLPRHLNL